MIVLAEFMPLNRATGLRTAVRVSSVNSAEMAEANGKGGFVWTAALLKDSDIVLTERAFNGSFADPVSIPTAAMTINVNDQPFSAVRGADGSLAKSLNFHAAPVTIYAAFSPSQAWPWPIEFMGRVTGVDAKGATRKLSMSVNETPFKKSVLSTYTGAGLINGDADLAGRFIPWIFGTAQNVEPVLINRVNNVWQFSGYGPIKSVLKLYEDASDFGASVGDFGSYAALVAASIPAGKWGTCLALGLIRLGAPNAGVITGDVEGDFSGSVFRTKPGAILQRIGAHLGITSSLNTSSLDAFDTHQGTRPSGGHVDYVISAQADFLSIAQDICTKSLGQAILSRKTGKLGVCRAVIGSAAVTMDAQGQLGTSAINSSESQALPYSRVQLAGVRSWRVHSADEIRTDSSPENGATRNDDGGQRLKAPVDLANAVPANGAVLQRNVVNPSGRPADRNRFYFPTGTTNGQGFFDTAFPLRLGEDIFAGHTGFIGGGATGAIDLVLRFFDGGGGVITLVAVPDTAISAADGVGVWISKSGRFPSTSIPAGASTAELLVSRGGTQTGEMYSGEPYVTGHQAGADVTVDQPVVSRINPVTGNAAGTFAAPDGLPFNRIVASGEARDGDVITFSLPSIPKITFGVGGNAATAGQNIVISDVGTTATGFTMRAVSQAVTPGTTYTDGSSTSGIGAEPSRVINRTNGGAPFDGRFIFRYSVTVGTIAPGEPGVIEVGLYIKRSGSWIPVGTGMHASSGTYSVAVTPGAVDFGAGNEFGVSVLYSEGRPADPTSLTSFLDVTYTTGTVVETSLTPTGASPIKWEARL